jgi:asparagine synthetase B (glutamine-hydrolysing)
MHFAICVQDFYHTFVRSPDESVDDAEILERALSCLAGIKGTFAFVIYDGATHRVLAARDAEGAQNMYWGVTGACTAAVCVRACVPQRLCMWLVKLCI